MPTQHAFDGATLEEALARVTTELGPRARITGAEKVRTGGVAGFFARERFEVTVELDDHAEEQVGDPAPRSLLDLVAEADGAEQPAPMSRPSTEGKTFQEVLRSLAADAGLAPATRATAPTPGTDLRVADPAPRTGAGELDAMLSALGVPAALLALTPAQDSVARHVLRALEGIPEAPPVLAGRGEVVVVVGDDELVLAAAAHLAAQLGVDAADVVVAAPERHGIGTIATADHAADHASAQRSGNAPCVVAVCPPVGRAGTCWAREIIDALAPVAVWSAVRADRKPEDVVAWTRALGRTDALVVGGCEDTSSPAAVLAAGIPVALVEGRRSTPAAWTALLMERLEP